MDVLVVMVYAVNVHCLVNFGILELKRCIILEDDDRYRLCEYRIVLRLGWHARMMWNSMRFLMDVMWDLE